MDHLHDQPLRWEVEVSKICDEGLKEALRRMKTLKALGMASSVPKQMPCTVPICVYMFLSKLLEL